MIDYCPSKLWDMHTNDEEVVGEARWAAFESLDAYGHLNYAASFGNEEDADWEERGDLLLCADFAVFTREDGGVVVAYHVVANSESGSFIMEVERGVVSTEEAFGIALSMADMGGDMCMTPSEWAALEESDARWRLDLGRAVGSEERQTDKTVECV